MESYVKVPIFPFTKYTSAKERGHAPVHMIPVSFKYDDRDVQVDEVLDCDRGISRKVGGMGFRYLCRVSWNRGDKEYTQDSVLWYDTFLDEWFVEVPKSSAPVDWDAATQLSDLDDFYGA